MTDDRLDSQAPLGGYEPRALTVTGDETTVRFDAQGLVPVVAIDALDGALLMLAYANREALRLTLDTGHAHYYSRSRQELWRKGATSGHVQHVIEVVMDCDGDSLMYRVKQTGPACHTGERSCFHRGLATDAGTAEAAVAPAAPEVAVAPASPGEVLELLERGRAAFEACMDDDFNTAGALAALFDVTREVNTLLNSDQPQSAGALTAIREFYARLAGDVLGLVPPAEASTTGLTPELIELLLQTRRELRAAKQWALADQIRDRLASLGVTLKDGPDGTTWSMA